MASDSKLPPYSEQAPPSASNTQIAGNRIAGDIQTCSIKDLQTDYLQIVRESATGYYVCLTVDPKPRYRIQVLEAPTTTGDIQIFSVDDSTLPIASARLNREAKPKIRGEPLAIVCSYKPYLPQAQGRPFTRGGVLASGEDYRCTIPIIKVPGVLATEQKFIWRTSLCEPFYELWCDGPLHNTWAGNYTKDNMDLRYLFATVIRRNNQSGQNIIEIRRGGGLEFELSVVLQMFVILHHKNKQLF